MTIRSSSAPESRSVIPAYIIAELANAHQGQSAQLLHLVDAAADAGAQGVKVQWFKYDSLAMPDYEWYDAYLKLFIEPEVWAQVVARAAERGLHVWADIFDDWGVQMARSLKGHLSGVKLPPTVLEDDRLAMEILNLKLPTLVGVGGWTEDEIATRMRYLKKSARTELILMHGFQGFPTSLEDCNLSRIAHYLRAYGCRVGLADHVDGGTQDAIDIPAHAVCMGASIIEKHITLDRAEQGYDYYSALEPSAFAEMVKKVRAAEIMIGGMERSENERKYLSAVPRATIARPAKTGDLLSARDFVFRRTGNKEALTPSALKSRLPATARRLLKSGEPITDVDLHKPKVVVAVICRLKSTRLKRKALATIGGVASALRCLNRCKQIRLADQIVLATSDLPEDDDLVPLAAEADVSVVRGDPDSVLNRLLSVADVTGADVVVRVTGDCPVIAPEVIDFLLSRHVASGMDYTGLSGVYPVGLAGEAYSTPALRQLSNSNADLSLTEYLRYYFEWNRKTFRCDLARAPKLWQGSYRLTLDVQEDLDMFNKLYASLAAEGSSDSTAEILQLLGTHPEIAATNAHVGLIYKTDPKLIAMIRRAVKIRNPLPDWVVKEKL